jgi:hypothetical protein
LDRRVVVCPSRPTVIDPVLSHPAARTQVGTTQSTRKMRMTGGTIRHPNGCLFIAPPWCAQVISEPSVTFRQNRVESSGCNYYFTPPARERSRRMAGLPASGGPALMKDHRSNQSRLPDPHCKRMARPIRAIPRRIFASGSVMDAPVAITPTIIPPIKINHRIMRSPPHISRMGCRPTFLTIKLNAYSAPFQIHWNIYEIGPLSRGGSHKFVRETHRCMNTTFLHVWSGRGTPKNTSWN